MAVSPKKRKTRKRKNRDSKNNTTTGLVVVLILLVIFGVGAYRYRDRIGIDLPNSAENPTTEIPETAASSPSITEQNSTAELPEEPSVTVVREKEPPKPATEKPAETESVKPQPEKQQSSKPDRPKQPETAPIAPQIKTEEKQLFFVRYSESTESVEIVPVIRRISYESSPLTQTLNTLLYGPNVSELSRNLVTMIPDKTKILSINIKTGIATINFNEEFMFNTNGREGTEAQLAQIVYTATQFPTVSAVQFLIEGEKKTYMPDGSYIELPLSRNSF